MDECLRHQCVVGLWSSIAWSEEEEMLCASVMLLSQPAGITANSGLLNLCKPVQYCMSPLHEVLFQRAVSD